jgi:hypothetical protein
VTDPDLGVATRPPLSHLMRAVGCPFEDSLI